MTDIHVVRRATNADAERIADAERRYIDCAWTAEQVESEIANENALFLVAECGGAFAGYLSGVFAADECEISNIAVETDYRRCGIATKLFGELLRIAAERGTESVFLLVRDGNAAAVALYSSLGFETVGRRRAYYGEADAVIMRKCI